MSTPVSAAAAAPIGITINAVAVFEINWPRTAVSRKIPTRSAYPPASPIASTSQSASFPAAPEDVIAVESGIIPPTRITVVHEIPS